MEALPSQVSEQGLTHNDTIKGFKNRWKQGLLGASVGRASDS